MHVYQHPIVLNLFFSGKVRQVLPNNKMTPSALARIIQLTAENLPEIKCSADYINRLFLERGCFTALALCASPEWLSSALACVRLPGANDPAENDVEDVNWDLVRFFAAWVAQQPTLVLPALHTLLADESRRLVALGALATTTDFTSAGHNVPLHDFLMSYANQAIEWPEIEYDYYAQSFIGMGAEVAIADLSDMSKRVPPDDIGKCKILSAHIEYFKSLVQRDGISPSPTEQRRRVAAGLAHMKKHGVIQLILDSSRSRF